MAKRIDITKIERIRESAIAIISESGAQAASVAEIAKRADVSVGYMYRHYKSKEELVDYLLDSALNRISNKLEELLAENIEVDDLLRAFVEYMVSFYETDRVKIKFILMLQNDFAYPFPKHISDRLRNVFAHLTEHGKASGGINERITADTLYLAVACLPLQYLGMRMRNLFDDQNENVHMVDEIMSLCLKIIK